MGNACKKSSKPGSDRRIVILGKTGAGKSSLANTIFGEQVFEIGHTSSPQTNKCKAETRSVKGRNITLIDTPGFFDPDMSEEDLRAEIVRCITECAPGPHAFLIVLQVERYTKQEQAVITKICQYFSEEALKYATVVFTHGDQLVKRQKIMNFVRKNKPLNDLVKKCGGRCHVIDNKRWNGKPKSKYKSNQFQVKRLLKSIDRMVMENKENCYTNEMLQKVEEEIKEQEQIIRQSSRNKSDYKTSEEAETRSSSLVLACFLVSETREQAKNNEFGKLLQKLAHIQIGELLGAFLGVPEMIKKAIQVLKSS